jgi:hypothetical protein
MIYETATISTSELQEALQNYCAVNGGIPKTVIVLSYAKQIVVSLEPGGMVTADEFNHAATGT